MQFGLKAPFLAMLAFLASALAAQVDIKVDFPNTPNGDVDGTLTLGSDFDTADTGCGTISYWDGSIYVPPLTVCWDRDEDGVVTVYINGSSTPAGWLKAPQGSTSGDGRLNDGGGGGPGSDGKWWR